MRSIKLALYPIVDNKYECPKECPKGSIDLGINKVNIL